MSTVVLGINHYFHDTSACVLVDGRLVAAVEEERFSREKHTTAFPLMAIARCLAAGGLSASDVTNVAVSAEPLHKWNTKLKYAMAGGREGAGFLKSEVRRYRGRAASLDGFMTSTWPDAAKRPRLHYVRHHVAHVGGSFLVSGYDEAALLGIDGSGEWSTSLLGMGRGREIDVFQESLFPCSLGSFYESVTEWCGFQPNYDEGKTMGLAPYGDPSRFLSKVGELVKTEADGGIWLDMSYFNFQFHNPRRYTPKFEEAFGPARKKGEDFSEHHRDVAAAFQRVLEDRAMEMCRLLHARTRAKYLVVSGGVALNSVMNGRIVREGPFEDLYVMPGAGDNGTCIGAAYWAYNNELGFPRNFVHDDPYVGTSYTDAELRKTLEACNLPIERHDDVERVVARMVADGKMLAWFQGKMEFGPRSLGNRSILADPTRPDMKEALNARVKHREAFRPFAPACPRERAAEFFDARVVTDDFMLKVFPVRPEHRASLPAITHVDGSARLQTVDKKTNPRFHALLVAFGALKGPPVLLNTSFNIMGEPIVESPVQAIRCFYSTGLDAMALGNYILRKPTAPA